MKTTEEKINRILEILDNDVIMIFPDMIFTDKELPELCEAKDCFTPIPGLKGYSFRKDKPSGIPGPGNQYHYHIYLQGKEVFAVNNDGTGHDGFHNVRIDKELADYLRQKGANVPDTNLIECRDYSNKQLLFD